MTDAAQPRSRTTPKNSGAPPAHPGSGPEGDEVIAFTTAAAYRTVLSNHIYPVPHWPVPMAAVCSSSHRRASFSNEQPETLRRHLV